MDEKILRLFNLLKWRNDSRCRSVESVYITDMDGTKRFVDVTTFQDELGYNWSLGTLLDVYEYLYKLTKISEHLMLKCGYSGTSNWYIDINNYRSFNRTRHGDILKARVKTGASIERNFHISLEDYDAKFDAEIERAIAGESKLVTVLKKPKVHRSLLGGGLILGGFAAYLWKKKG